MPFDTDASFQEAAQRRSEFFLDIKEKLDAIDIRLNQLDLEIKEAQEIKPGAITMKFKVCKTPCLGCPHITWMKWFDPSKQLKRRAPGWHAAEVPQPLRHARAATAAPAKYLIEEAVLLLERKRKMVELLRTLNNIARHVYEEE